MRAPRRLKGGSRRGFRRTMQAEAYIVIIIISPLDIKDLSFSFGSLSLLPPSAGPSVGRVPLSFCPRLSSVPSSLSLLRSVSRLPASPPFSLCLPKPRVASGLREMTICKLTPRFFDRDHRERYLTRPGVDNTRSRDR